MAGSPIRAMVRCGNGGNSRICRIETDNGTYALKLYPNSDSGSRNRLGHERAALTFLAGHGAPVPRLVAADPAANIALLEWIDGEPPMDWATGDGVSAMEAFMGLLHALSDAPGAADLPEAVEACLSAAALLDQIESRRRRLDAIEDARLRRQMNDRFDPAFEQLRYRLDRIYDGAGLDAGLPEPVDRLTLSASDFGLHNALRRKDGQFIFLDFEYFGWDDPVKLTADTLWHPGMRLSPADRCRLLGAAGNIYGRKDPAFATRLAAQIGLFGLRWCLIVLSDFLPERWAHRVNAGTAVSWADAKNTQSIKADALLDRVGRILDVAAMDWPVAFCDTGNGRNV